MIWKYDRECERFFAKLTPFLVVPCDRDQTFSDGNLHACTGHPDCTGCVTDIEALFLKIKDKM
jgi:hypothetical protein